MKSVKLFLKDMTSTKATLMSITPILSVMTNIKTMLLALLIIILIDMITGIRKRLFLRNIKVNLLKKEFWKNVHSSGIRATWRKTYEYIIGILAFIVVDALVMGSSRIEVLDGYYSLSEVAVLFSCIVEIYSIYENMEAVSGNNTFKRFLKVFPLDIRSIFTLKK